MNVVECTHECVEESKTVVHLPRLVPLWQYLCHCDYFLCQFEWALWILATNRPLRTNRMRSWWKNHRTCKHACGARWVSSKMLDKMLDCRDTTHTHSAWSSAPIEYLKPYFVAQTNTLAWLWKHPRWCKHACVASGVLKKMLDRLQRYFPGWRYGLMHSTHWNASLQIAVLDTIIKKTYKIRTLLLKELRTF